MTARQIARAGLVAAVALVIVLALFKPESAIVPVLVIGALFAWDVTRIQRAARRVRRPAPCAICGRRYAGADMVEHREMHRVCDS